MTITLCILTIIASWIYHLPQEWAVTLTVFSSLVMVATLIRYITSASDK